MRRNINRVITRARRVKQFGTVTGWSEDKSFTVSSARKCASSWFHAFGPATANARAPKCVAEELTTRSPYRFYQAGFWPGVYVHGVYVRHCLTVYTVTDCDKLD